MKQNIYFIIHTSIHNGLIILLTTITLVTPIRTISFAITFPLSQDAFLVLTHEHTR